MSGSTTSSERAFVLGLDGVPWRFIEQWSDEGALPNFARMRDEGASGTLDSTRPPTTPLAWPSIATGVWPDKHGIYGFQNLSSEYSHEMYTSRDLAQPALWDQLGPAHVGNVPMTYPAREINGTMVTGMMTPSTDREFTHPPELQAEIDSRIPNYEISLDYPEYADRPDDFEDAVDDVLANRRDLMEIQMDRAGDDWQLFFFVYTAPDRFQHLVWDMDRLRAHYAQLDEILGDVMAYADDHDADLYVVSDHGFGPIEGLVYVNRILEQEGYLFRREDEGTAGRSRASASLETPSPGRSTGSESPRKPSSSRCPDGWSTPSPSRSPAITPLRRRLRSHRRLRPRHGQLLYQRHGALRQRHRLAERSARGKGRPQGRVRVGYRRRRRSAAGRPRRGRPVPD